MGKFVFVCLVFLMILRYFYLYKYVAIVNLLRNEYKFKDFIGFNRVSNIAMQHVGAI